MTYTDLAITPPKADEFDALDIYHTRGGEDALARKHRDDAIRAGTTPRRPPPRNSSHETVGAHAPERIAAFTLSGV